MKAKITKEIWAKAGIKAGWLKSAQTPSADGTPQPTGKIHPSGAGNTINIPFLKERLAEFAAKKRDILMKGLVAELDQLKELAAYMGSKEWLIYSQNTMDQFTRNRIEQIDYAIKTLPQNPHQAEQALDNCLKMMNSVADAAS